MENAPDRREIGGSESGIKSTPCKGLESRGTTPTTPAKAARRTIRSGYRIPRAVRRGARRDFAAPPDRDQSLRVIPR